MINNERKIFFQDEFKEIVDTISTESSKSKRGVPLVNSNYPCINIEKDIQIANPTSETVDCIIIKDNILCMCEFKNNVNYMKSYAKIGFSENRNFNAVSTNIVKKYVLTNAFLNIEKCTCNNIRENIFVYPRNYQTTPKNKYFLDYLKNFLVILQRKN